MTFLRMVLIAGVFFLSLPCWPQDNAEISADVEAKSAQLLQQGARLAADGKSKEAIEYLDKVIAVYEEKFKDSQIQIFCARWSVESLMYLLDAASQNKNTKVLSETWAYAYYVKAYVLQDLGRLSEAKTLLQQAISLSPRNAQFLSELGSVYQREKNWPMALQTYKTAESAAQEFSPPELKNAELARAWRGMAYVLVEQNQLDEAEKLYRRCLELNKNDAKASNELRYVLNLKVKRGIVSSEKNSDNSNQPQVSDPIYLNDAVNATYFAALRCGKSSDPPNNPSNVMLVGAAAAHEMQLRYPAMKPPEIAQALSDRLAKVKATVDDQINKRGCEAPEIHQLVENFKKFSSSQTPLSP